MKKRSKGNLLIGAGLVFLVAALCMTGFNIWDENRAQVSASALLEQMEEVIPREGAQEQAPNASWGDIDDPDVVPQMLTIEIDGHGYIGELYFPTLSLTLPVMADWDYDKLKIAPCLYLGSVYEDNMIIAGHNYRSHFGGLKQLQVGDEVLFTDVEGIAWRYEVHTLETIGGDAVEQMVESEWDLSLFTCTYGGANRLTVRCERAQ